MTNEQRLFEIDEFAPRVPAAARVEAFQEGFRRIGVHNLMRDLHESFPLIEDRLSQIAQTGGKIAGYGVELQVRPALPPTAEA